MQQTERLLLFGSDFGCLFRFGGITRFSPLMPSPDVRPKKPLMLLQGQWPSAARARPDLPQEQGGQAAGRAAEQIARIVTDIQALATDRGWNQRTLAARSGVGEGTLSALLNGQSWPDSWTLTRLAAALDADLEFMPRLTHEAVRYRDYMAAQQDTTQATDTRST